MRALYQHGILPLIGARHSSITTWLKIRAKRTNLHSSEWLKAALKELQLNMRRLSDRKRRIEIEAKAAEYDRNSVPDLLNLTVGLQCPDPIDGNPFAMENLRHRVWVDESRRAEEAVHRLNTALIRAKRELPPASPQTRLRRA